MMRRDSGACIQAVVNENCGLSWRDGRSGLFGREMSMDLSRGVRAGAMPATSNGAAKGSINSLAWPMVGEKKTKDGSPA